MLGLSVLRNEDSPESVGTHSGCAVTSGRLGWCTMDGSTPRGALPRYVWPLLDKDFVVSHNLK